MLYEIYTLDFPFDLRCESVTCYSYTMDTSGLPDMYTCSLRAADLRADKPLATKVSIPVI